MKSSRVSPHFPFFVSAGVILLVALWAGLIRLGWSWPPIQAAWAVNHGPLMLGGFLGTLISLERAAALAMFTHKRWPYLAPLCAGLGGIALVLGFPPLVGRGLLLSGSLGLCAIFWAIVRLHPDPAYRIMGLGAGLWLGGNGLWLLGTPVAQVTPWWIGFLVLTIAAERLELARILATRREARWAFLGSVGVYCAALGLMLIAFTWGVRLAGVGLALLAAWLFIYDIARKTVRQTGLPRFAALCMLSGYGWLLVAGLLWLWGATFFVGGPLYDAMLHSLLLGFVFAMLFAHAPIIFPALLGVTLSFHTAFYTHWGLLQLGLLMRVAGDLTFQAPLRQWGGLLNALAIVLFVINTARAVKREP